MTDLSRDEPIEQPPPSDVERMQALARLIHQRIAALSTVHHTRSFTAAEARELFVLQHLRDHWLLEASE